MKTLLITLITIFIFAYTTSNAQLHQGSFRIGGGATYTYASFDDDNTYAAISFSPALAYFPIDNLSVGLAFPLSASSGNFGTGEYSSFRYSFGPEVRYYFPFGKWALFPEVIYSFGKNASENSGFSTGDPVLYKTETNFSAFRAGAGITYFMNPHVGVEGILYYQNNQQEASNPFAVVSYEKSINFSIGFQIYLHRE
jgi:hypothetical protein